MKKDLFSFLRPFVLLLLLSSLTTLVQAQDVWTLQDHSAISIDGTSTLHDWTMTMEEGSTAGEANFKMEGSSISGLDMLSITLDAEGLKSGKKPMDNNAYKAMNTDEHPQITFVMTEVASMENDGETVNLEVVGDMSVAGSTKQVTLPASCVMSGDVITCTGSYTFPMSEFGIQPPSVMLGTIKTGDEITLNYEASFSK